MNRMRRFALLLICGWLALACAISISGRDVTARALSQPAVSGGGAAAGRSTMRPPTNLRVAGVGATWVTLRWQGSPNASAYQLLRDGHRIARVSSTHVRIRNLTPATFSIWKVASVSASGAVSGASIAAPITTRARSTCTMYVASRTGDNANDGSEHAPLRTVTAAVNRAGAGDSICLTGTFVEDLTIRSGGTRSAPLVLRSAPGTRATVRGRMWISDTANDVVVQGLKIDGRNLDGGELPSPTIEGDRVRLIGNDITNHRHHICVILGSIRGYGTARKVVLDGNRIHDCGRRPGNNHQHGVYIENATATRIVNNVIADNADRGIQLYPNAHTTLIMRNVIVGNGEGVIFSGAEGYASSSNQLSYNVITHSRTRFNIEYWWPEGNPIGTGNLASHNCVWGGAWGNIALPAIGYVQRDNVTQDPQYRDRAHGDFRPTVPSMCTGLLQGSALPLLSVPLS